MTEEQLLADARDFVTRGAWVLHAGIGVVGQASQVWAPCEYVDPNGLTLDTPVLGLADGNRFILRADEAGSIVEVTPSEVEVYEQLVGDMRTVITGALVAMAQRAPDTRRMPIVLALVNAAVATQLRALRSGSP